MENRYYGFLRKELLELIPMSNREGTLLEVGAAGGRTLVYAKENGFANKVYGIELCKIENSFQNDKKIDSFLIRDIEKIELPYKENFFDVILCADVLEHLVDPWKVLSELRLYLKDGGVLIASIPNIRHYSALKKIFINGSFKYEEAGIFDKTHLRFFCKKDIKMLFESQGYKVINLTNNVVKKGKLSKKVNKITFGIFEEFLVIQYYLVGKKV
jgi:SAM-dependent methyltransferase